MNVTVNGHTYVVTNEVEIYTLVGDSEPRELSGRARNKVYCGLDFSRGRVVRAPSVA